MKGFRFLSQIDPLLDRSLRANPLSTGISIKTDKSGFNAPVAKFVYIFNSADIQSTPITLISDGRVAITVGKRLSCRLSRQAAPLLPLIERVKR